MALTPNVTLKSFEFRKEREASWRELEDLVERARKRGVKSLDAREVMRLPQLYRAALSSLSVARAISLDKNVVSYLESLVARSYFLVYGTKQHFRDSVGDFVLRRFPRALRACKWQLLISVVFMVGGAVAAFAMTAADPENFYTFVSEDYAQGRNPATSTEELRAVLYDETSFGESLATFAASLFTHNARIGIMAFAVGFLAGIPVFLLLFMNGLILGAFAALYHSRGLGPDIWGWLLPHGVTELLAVVLCGAAGLVLAQALVFPGRRTRLDNLARRGRVAGTIVIGAVFMFFIAGLIEGFFRQMVTDITVRYTVAGSTAVFWLWYFTLVGRKVGASEHADLSAVLTGDDAVEIDHTNTVGAMEARPGGGGLDL